MLVEKGKRKEWETPSSEEERCPMLSSLAAILLMLLSYTPTNKKVAFPSEARKKGNMMYVIIVLNYHIIN